jgi:hypothetical protein
VSGERGSAARETLLSWERPRAATLEEREFKFSFLFKLCSQALQCICCTGTVILIVRGGNSLPLKFEVATWRGLGEIEEAWLEDCGGCSELSSGSSSFSWRARGESAPEDDRHTTCVTPVGGEEFRYEEGDVVSMTSVLTVTTGGKFKVE